MGAAFPVRGHGVWRVQHMAETIPDDPADLVDEFRQALEDCEDLYRDCAVECADARPGLTGEKRSEFFHRMMDLHRGLVLKIFVAVAYVDRRWAPEELVLARQLLVHVWHRRLDDKQIRVALAHYLDQTALTWDVLLGPFERLQEFRRRSAELKTVVLRIANLVAKVDGRVAPAEVEQLQWVQAQLQRVLDRVPLYTPDLSESVPAAGRAALKEAALEASPFQKPSTLPDRSAAAVPPIAQASLADCTAQLDALVGLATIKQEVRSLVNLLKMQKVRTEFDLPQTTISLHSVFRGNPGTGKTSVARLLGQIFHVLGLLARGHLIETDRSGLVAEYAGQTAPKTHKKIDEALDGVLFIDEAYSLVAERGDDPYGLEAVQVLLKRMEDNRDRLIVMLAGYPAPIDRLLKSNPGLSSRFSRMLDFPDYSAAELGSIFESLCRKNRDTVSVLTRVKLLLGFQYLLAGSEAAAPPKERPSRELKG
jgi:hypothetical protein